jgi:uncharacterized protein YbjQ (UPF0145 family)
MDHQGASVDDFPPVPCRYSQSMMREEVTFEDCHNRTTGRKKLEMIGVVRGSTVQTRNIGRDILGGLKTIVGGEIRAYSEMMDKARDIATERMIQDAQKLGADAVVNLRYATSAVMQGAAEVMAYGTAVKFI